MINLKDLYLVNANNYYYLESFEVDEKGIINYKINETKKKLYDSHNKFLILPLFIDSHTHGGYGFSFNDLLEEDIKILKYFQNLIKEGVGYIYASTVAVDKNKLIKLQDKINNSKFLDWILAWHMEGPFISKIQKGAHDENVIVGLDEKILLDLNKNKKLPIIITIAPEEENNLDLISKYYKNFIFSLGHSNADSQIALNSLQKGIKKINHLYNAMSSFHHSKPGIVNAIFENLKLTEDNEILVELISDGRHVCDEVINFTYKNININNLIIVSDSLSTKGLENGKYKLGNIPIIKKDNSCYLETNPTKLAGSSMPYNLVLKHFKEITKCSWNEIVKISSFNIWKQLGIEAEKGFVKKNQLANFVVIDFNFNIKFLYKNGKKLI